MAGAEIRRHARKLLHPDGARQARIQPRPQLRGRHADARRQEKADHLPPRVHTRIRAPRRLQPQLLRGTTAAVLRAAAAEARTSLLHAEPGLPSLLWNCAFGQAAGQCLAVMFAPSRSGCSTRISCAWSSRRVSPGESAARCGRGRVSRAADQDLLVLRPWVRHWKCSTWCLQHDLGQGALTQISCVKSQTGCYRIQHLASLQHDAGEGALQGC